MKDEKARLRRIKTGAVAGSVVMLAPLSVLLATDDPAAVLASVVTSAVGGAVVNASASALNRLTIERLSKGNGA